MQTHNNLYLYLHDIDNLYEAYKKAKKGKSSKFYVKEFQKDLMDNLAKLRLELFFKTYKPKPLKTFIIRDPKTRKISKSDFRDRIVHHVLVSILEPIFDKTFIYDSYANRINKGTTKAIERLNLFVRKVTKNNTRNAYCLKADIRHYFENVNHEVLINIIRKRIKDENVIDLIKLIVNNYYQKDIGMPLGNLTSQFFANVYLNELDYFIKHKLKIKYYIRYVDDFVILHQDKNILNFYKEQINKFLKNNLKIELHKDKSKISSIKKGITFLGFRHFYHYSIPKKNKRKIVENKIKDLIKKNKEIKDYKRLMQKFESILAHLEIGNTYYLRKNIILKLSKEVKMLENLKTIQLLTSNTKSS